MLYKHIVILNSGKTEEYSFKNKRDSQKAISNARLLNATWHTIKSVEIIPVNFQEKKTIITF